MDRQELAAALGALDVDSLVPGPEGARTREAVQRLRLALGDPAATGAEVDFRDLEPGDAGWIIARHAELYAAEEGFDASFEPLVARILSDYLTARDPDRERAWVAVKAGVRLGTIFCVDSGTPGVAKLRLFWLEPSARGMGLAPAMLERCLAFAREAGYARMVLWTHESHRAAGRLYARSGFTLTKAVPVTSFGVALVEQTWERDLAAP